MAIDVTDRDDYHLPSHVYACRINDGVVFLDARHDRYFGLGGAKIKALADFVLNRPLGDKIQQEGALSQTLPAGLQDVADSLIQRGLLRRSSGGSDPDEDRNDRGLSLPPPAMDSPRTQAEVYRSPRVMDVIHFALACLKARLALRRWSLQTIAKHVTSARDTNHPSNCITATVELTEIFRKLRSLTFSEKNRCLFSALSLVYFLQRYGHFPYFVIGVKTGPFGAHSWLQQGETVLDGDPGAVGQFVPILIA